MIPTRAQRDRARPRPRPAAGRWLAALWALLGALACCQLARAYYDRELFRSIVRNDATNDDAIDMSAQELLRRSGFGYEEHYAIADDGYITQLLRVINPRADRAQLRGPPVMVHHGASADSTLYLISSSIQHHPEPWPRASGGGDGGGGPEAEQQAPPMTSSNRSLAFTLANNGYDVWLVGTRGSNFANQAYEPDEHARELNRHRLGWAPRELNYDLVRNNRKRYWQYGLDEIIDYEIKRQMDKVLEVTGASEVFMFTFSLSTPTTMAFLAREPEYARRVRLYIQMAPAIAADHFSTFDSIYFERICPHFPTRGIGFVPFYSVTPYVRKLIIKLARSRRVRYTLVHRFLTALFGPSLKYMSNLELNVLAHTWKSVSFKSIQHYCQNSLNNRLTRFNFGKRRNLQKYGQIEPPRYEIGQLQVQNWLVISGTYDGLADPTTVQRLVETTRTPKPAEQIIVQGYNHFDFIGGVENARYVNLPILAALNARADPPRAAAAAQQRRRH